MIYKVLGSLLFIEAFLLLLCLGVSYYFEEDDLFAFSISTFVTLQGGLLCRYFGRNADNRLSRRDSFLLVTLAWTIFSLFGTLPFLIGGYVDGFTNAFFESMSGFTTTGATIIDDVEILPHGIIFWRSLMQWLGGLGIVFFTIALLPNMTGGSVKVFAAEATGPIKSKLHPKLSTSAKWIWTIYLILTIACGGCFYLLGMDVFNALNYAMTSTATGGFAPHNNSLEFFNSPLIEYTCTLFCFLSGVNFILLYTSVSKFNLRRLVENIEFRVFGGMIVAFTLYIMLALILKNGYAIEHAFRSALFTVVSFITTTGLFNDDASLWPHSTWVVLLVCMFVGGMSGSTSGGFKIVRIVMLFKMIRNEFRQLLHPSAVLPLHISGVNISQQRRSSLVALLAINVVLALIVAFILSGVGVDAMNSVAIILSCLSNVGMSLSVEIGSSMSWADLPDFVKWILSFFMLMGRLEIFTVLVIFTPQFWTEN